MGMRWKEEARGKEEEWYENDAGEEEGRGAMVVKREIGKAQRRWEGRVASGRAGGRAGDGARMESDREARGSGVQEERGDGRVWVHI
jgi:hypothetical protein